MEQLLTWRKGVFDSNYLVYKDTLLRFSMNFLSLKNSAIATTQTGIYAIKTEGYSKAESKLFNNKNEVIAIIHYEWLNFKATIHFTSGERFNWSYQNNWLSRWSLNNHENKQIIYNASSGKGLIHSNIEDDVLLILGLFIREYYTRILVAFIFLMFILFLIKNVF